MKSNCWEIKKCGRQPTGNKAAELGVCPAATMEALDGTHGGSNGGRACWVIAGTLCDGEVQGTFSKKSLNCRSCDFYKLVETEESELETPFSLLTKIARVDIQRARSTSQ